MSEVSKSDNGLDKSVIENDDIFVFNLDHLCFNSYLSNSGRVNSPIPSSVDALYFDGNMYLIEFKGEPISAQDNKEKLKDIISLLKNDKCSNSNLNCPLSDDLFKSLNNIQSMYSDEILCNLKNKPIESIFLVLPKLYDNYCKKQGIESDKVEFFDWLFKISKIIIIVFLDDEFKSEIGESKSYKYMRRDHALVTKYSPLKGLINAENSIISQSDFNNIFLKKINN